VFYINKKQIKLIIFQKNTDCKLEIQGKMSYLQKDFNCLLLPKGNEHEGNFLF